MKYKTFRNLLVGGGAVVLLGVGVWCATTSKKSPTGSGVATSSTSTAPATTKPQTAESATTTTSGAVALAAGDEALRPMDRAILGWQKTAPEHDKMKDVFKSASYKVDAYHDPGKTGINRLKIDLDRDGKWDEKWDFEDGKVKRQIAPADDEVYSKKMLLDGDVWHLK